MKPSLLARLVLIIKAWIEKHIVFIPREPSIAEPKQTWRSWFVIGFRIRW